MDLHVVSIINMIDDEVANVIEVDFMSNILVRVLCNLGMEEI